MIVGIKDAVKLVVISIMSCCAVFISTLFLNYNIDIMGIENLIVGEFVREFYDAKRLTAVVISCSSGGVMLITTTVMLLFFIKNYIDTHKKELGILKALGYSNFKIAKSFWVFGISILIGTAAGFAAAFAIMGKFYEVQNEDKILPEFTCEFHPALFVCIVVLPAVVFAVVSIVYATLKLRTPVLGLIRDNIVAEKKSKRHKNINDGKSVTTKRGASANAENIASASADTKNNTFVSDVRKSTFKSRKSLVFFIIFGAFCFSAMTQMSLGVRELANPMMGYLLLSTGLVLAFVILFLAISTVINGNTKTVAMMKVFGYSDTSCRKAVLDCYRLAAYIGFVIGTGYQYGLMKLCFVFIFKDMENVPDYSFDVTAMFISLVAFAVLYEAYMYFGLMRIRKVSIKEVMLES